MLFVTSNKQLKKGVFDRPPHLHQDEQNGLTKPF